MVMMGMKGRRITMMTRNLMWERIIDRDMAGMKDEWNLPKAPVRRFL
jgi:hypothetical protein